MSNTDDIVNIPTDEEQTILASITSLEEELDIKPRRGKKKEEEKTEEARLSEEESRKRQELLAVYDALLTQKFYEQSFKVGSRISGMWRSRTTGQSNTIYKLVDAAGFNSGLAVNNYLNLLNMAYSLVVFNGQDMRSTSVSERLKMVESLPEVLIVALSQSLVEFDAKMREAVEVGRVNF